MNSTLYICNICETKPDQLSHHKLHLKTQKHTDKKEIFKLKLNNLSNDELIDNYNSNNIDEIMDNYETDIKKLKNEFNYDYINNLKIEMGDYIVSNKDGLKNKIHEIHNLIRNSGIGYGMTALKVFNIFYALKKIEDNNLFDKLNLTKKECKFSYLLKMANNHKDEKLAGKIYGDVLNELAENPLTSRLLFYEIPGHIKSFYFSLLIKEINEITKIENECNVLLSGKIYEYFIGRDQNAISELGAYFTDRHITTYIYDKLKIPLNKDNSIKNMCDMFGGSGGFTTGYIDYLNKNYKDKINWKKEINKIYHFDMNNDVLKAAGLEFLCMTNEIPDMKDNIAYKNSFNDHLYDKYFDLIITNPPYGGDKTNKSEGQLKMEKVKKYIKTLLMSDEFNEEQKNKFKEQYKKLEDIEKSEKVKIEEQKITLKTVSMRIRKYANEHKLKGNDKEACSLILLMEALADNGICAGVLKEGVFFNRSYSDIRKHLVNNFNVKKVISVPQDQFENTSTKTSIVIFENTEEKTKEIEFYEMIVEKYEKNKFEIIDGKVKLVENEGDIKVVNDKLITKITIEEFNNNELYSLNGKDYNKKIIKCGKDYELIKLSDICEFLPKSKRKASYGKDEGKYNFYSSSDKIKKCDVADYNEECLIIGDGGIANIQMDNNFSCSDHNFIIKTKYNTYIYNLLLGNINILSDGFTGSVLKNLSKKYLLNLKLPIPKTQEKINEWDEKISKQYNRINTKEKRVIELEKDIKEKINNIIDNEDCEEFDLNKYADIKSGKMLTKNNTISGNYNVYGGGESSIKHNCYNYEGYKIIISRVGNTIIKIINEKFYLTDNGFTLIFKNNSYEKYIMHYIYFNKELIENMKNGSNQKVITKTQLNSFKIPIPTNKELLNELEPLFKEVEELNENIEKTKIKYKKLIEELGDEAIIKD